MSLLKRKKEKESKSGDCCCGCNADFKETPSADTDICCSEADSGICCVKVLGAGCKNCQAMFENTKEAVASLGLPIEAEYITDLQTVMSYGVMSMPALVVNEKVAAMGKVYKAREIEKLLLEYIR